jgi:DNA (cytosine-5)-methyltransferase 1
MNGELIVDNFAGGGGASTGIARALGRPVDIAINHDAEAVAMHLANHPETKHFCQSIMAIDPRDACTVDGHVAKVALAWFSPDCKHHSKAKGGKPREKNIRDLAWVVVHWPERSARTRPTSSCWRTSRSSASGARSTLTACRSRSGRARNSSSGSAA